MRLSCYLSCVKTERTSWKANKGGTCMLEDEIKWLVLKVKSAPAQSFLNSRVKFPTGPFWQLLACCRCLKHFVNKVFNVITYSFPRRRCRGCRKRRTLRSNSFFEEFPRLALGKLLLVIFFFNAGDSQRRIAQYVGLNPSLISRICRRLQDVCSRDIQDRPFIPFGGPGTIVKCDESKFNHKPKVLLLLFCF